MWHTTFLASPKRLFGKLIILLVKTNHRSGEKAHLEPGGLNQGIECESAKKKAQTTIKNMSFGLDAYGSSSEDAADDDDDNGECERKMDEETRVQTETEIRKRPREEEEEDFENAPVLFETRLPPPSSSSGGFNTMTLTGEVEEKRKSIARKRYLMKQQKKLLMKSKGGSGGGGGGGRGRGGEEEDDELQEEDEEERKRRDVLANAKINGGGSGLSMFLPKPAAVGTETLGFGDDFHAGGGFGGGGGGGTRIDLSGGTKTKRDAVGEKKEQKREQNEPGVPAVPTIHPSQLYEVDDEGNYIHQKLIDSMQQQQEQQQPSMEENELATTTVDKNLSIEEMLVKSNKMIEITQDDIRGSYNPLLANEHAIQNTNDMGGSLGKVSGTARAKNQVTSLVHDARQAELKLAQQQGMRHRTMAKSKYGW